MVPQYDDADGSGWIACRMLDVAATTNFPNHVHMGLCGIRWTRKEVDEQVVRVFLQLERGFRADRAKKSDNHRSVVGGGKEEVVSSGDALEPLETGRQLRSGKRTRLA